MGKYAPLEEFLATREENTTTLTYEEMEELLGFKLPNSAYKHRAWWSNGKKGGSKFWLRVGWLVDSVVLNERVSFRKALDMYDEATSKQNEEFEEETCDSMVTLDIADIPAIIKDLHILMLEGLLSHDEFEEKKASLLSLL
ncbi:MAG: hypothetical protein JXQ27_16970 [Acidobacteria bacterium]|nr:hypothetical protein [Acidobacteriota bacterium]